MCVQKKVVATAEAVGVVAGIGVAAAAVEEGDVVADVVGRKQAGVVAYGEEPYTPDWERRVEDDGVEYERDVAHAAAAVAVEVEVEVGGDVEEEEGAGVVVPMGLAEEERKAVSRVKGMGLKDAVGA